MKSGFDVEWNIGNKHFSSFVEGFISFQFFKESEKLLWNAMYTFLSCPLNCLLYSFFSFISCKIQPHLIVLWIVPKQMHLVILKSKFVGNGEKILFPLFFSFHLQSTHEKYLGKYYLFYSKYIFLRNCI